MSAELTELELFHRFLTRWIESDDADQALDHVVAEFRMYQDERKQLQDRLREAEDDIERGDVGPLDVEALTAQIRAAAIAKQEAG